MCFADKIRVFVKQISGMCYSTAGGEFNANESTIYIKLSIYKQKHNVRYCSVDENVMNRGSKKSNPVFLQGAKFH